MYYDLNIRAENLQKTSYLARTLGFSGICLVIPYSRDFSKKIRELKEKAKESEIDVVLGAEISGGQKIKKTARGIRKNVELVFVEGGSQEVNREAVATPEVDVLTNPVDSGKPGINHVLARLANKNNVSIAFDFLPVIQSYGKTRASLLATMLDTAWFVKKYRAPFIISSGAKSEFDLRSPSELFSFARFLGFRDPSIKKALSDNIIKENRKRLSNKWIMPGVEVE